MTRSDHSSAFIVDWIFFILTDNKDIFKILYEFEIWPNPITDSGVSYSLLASGKIQITLHNCTMGENDNVVTNRAPSF